MVGFEEGLVDGRDVGDLNVAKDCSELDLVEYAMDISGKFGLLEMVVGSKSCVSRSVWRCLLVIEDVQGIEVEGLGDELGFPPSDCVDAEHGG